MIVLGYWWFWWRSTGRIYCWWHVCLYRQYRSSSEKIVRHIQLPPTVWSNKHTTLMILAKYMSWKGPHIGIYKATGQYPLQGWIFHKRSEISYLSSYYSICQHLTGNDIRLLEKYDLWDVQDLWNIFFTLIWSDSHLQPYWWGSNGSGHRQQKKFYGTV